MRRIICTAMIRLLSALLLAGATIAAQPAAPIVVIKAARLIDGTGSAPLTPATVVIRGDRIDAVGGAIATPTGAHVVDLGGATLLPGLIDLHTHLTSSG